ncbi:MAG: MotA/TolQ/ExbB proton channel family protein [Muribaculaceae bacterium]|nr:MotA/TolQ/ExbB proton channel family protein [Bacteroides sp.]MDE6226681.1 MotA/TolQ/ExbB proton channel family protein [Muribaculaceae bacterium]
MESQKPAAPASAAARVKKEEKISNVRGIRNAFLVIIACAIVAVCIFLFGLGAPGNFEGNDNAGHPINLAGTVYKGGFIVPILMTLLLTVIVLSVERWIALSSAAGKGNTTKFVQDIKADLAKNDIDGAMQRCKKQKGSVASVIYNTLVKYKEMDANTVLSKEQKLTTLRSAVEEATALEMPSLSQNLPIVATLTTLGTLVGLLGTVMGMIKSFQALAASGSPDSTELSTGISEALVNTAFGIATGAFAVISYNFFTNKIDNLSYAIDEIGFSIVATFAATHK